ncbi:MAG: PAS domain-containing protein, partial [Desulfocapsa sp.]|nr:PAS domain-containing protein [Desulfocapsa sp.]
MNDKDHILQQNEKIRVLELQNQILSIHWEESPDGILVVDSDWKMVSYNQRFVDMWGIAQHILDAKDDRA